MIDDRYLQTAIMAAAALSTDAIADITARSQSLDSRIPRSASDRYLPTACPRALTSTVSFAAILLVSWPPVKCRRHTGLLDPAGSSTADWPRRQTHGIRWIGGGRQSHVLMSSAVAAKHRQVKRSGGLPWCRIDNLRLQRNFPLHRRGGHTSCDAGTEVTHARA